MENQTEQIKMWINAKSRGKIKQISICIIFYKLINA